MGKRTGKVGADPHEPTPAQRNLCKVLAAVKTPQRAIARQVGVTYPTLLRYYKAELRDGPEDTVAALGSVVIKAGLSGNINAAMHVLNRFGGHAWRAPASQHQLGGIPGGEPLRVEHATTEELQQELAELRRRRAIADGSAGVVISGEAEESVVH